MNKKLKNTNCIEISDADTNNSPVLTNATLNSTQSIFISTPINRKAAVAN